MPEDPLPLLLIEVPKNEDSNHQKLLSGVESEIHEHLYIIGLSKITRYGGGKEWFLSNTETIVSIANLMGLSVQDPGADIENE